MSIKKLYRQLGNTSLNISIYFTILASVFALLYIKSQKLEMAIFFLLLLSWIYYMIHLYYLKKSNKTLMSNHVKGSQNEISIYLIDKDKSYIYFFDPNGMAELKFRLQNKIKGMYISYFVNNVEIEKLQLKIDHSGSYFFSANNGRIFVRIKKSRKNIQAEIIFPEYTIHVKKKSSYEMLFLKDHHQIATVKKGWLPITWTKLFRLNTPVLLFHDRITKDECYAIHLVLGVIYWR